MKDFIKKLNLKPYKVIIFIILISGLWLYLSYTHPRNIYYNYKGMEYENGITGEASPIVIEINGKYTNSILGREDSFLGEIKVGNKIFNFTDKPLSFNSNKIGILVWDPTVGNAYSLIYVSPMLKELTIQTINKYIVAPCRHRTEAAVITNKLLKNSGSSWVVK
jgi:hypothetical protein